MDDQLAADHKRQGIERVHTEQRYCRFLFSKSTKFQYRSDPKNDH